MAVPTARMARAVCCVMLVSAIAGCTGAGTGRTSTAAAKASHRTVSSASRSPSAEPDPTGELAAETTGTVTIAGPSTATLDISYAPSRGVVLSYSDLRAADGDLLLSLADTASALGCGADGNTSSLTEPTMATTQTQTLKLSALDYLQMTGYRVAALIPQQGAGRCTAADFSVGTLQWHVPVGLTAAHAVDHGTREYAAGTVLDAGGSYLVATDDRLSAVATRFGLTVDQVFWLNPFRKNGTNTELFAGETLNLALDHRDR